MRPISEWTDAELSRLHRATNSVQAVALAAEVLRLREKADVLASFTAEDYPGWYRERAEKAESELARQRPVIEASIALRDDELGRRERTPRFHSTEEFLHVSGLRAAFDEAVDTYRAGSTLNP